MSSTHVLISHFPTPVARARFVESVAEGGGAVSPLLPSIDLVNPSSAAVGDLIRAGHGVFLYARITDAHSDDPMWQSAVAAHGDGDGNLFLIIHEAVQGGPAASHLLSRHAYPHRILVPGAYLANIEDSGQVMEDLHAVLRQIYGRVMVMRVAEVETSRAAWLE